MLRELQDFAMGVEAWWTRRKRGDSGQGKRQGPTLAAPSAKHPALDQQQQQQNHFGIFAAEPPLLDAAAAAQFAHFATLAADAASGAAALPAPATDPRTAVITLNVGGSRHVTTAATLASAAGSYFSAAVTAGASEFFVDRDGEVFATVLEYLRALRYSDGPPPMPSSIRELTALVREAEFYRLPGLAAAALEAQVKARAVEVGSEYVETGFLAPAHLDAARIAALVGLNARLAARRAEGWRVGSTEASVLSHGDGTRRCLAYHVVLSRGLETG
jgi:hypothetical protein